MQFLALFAMFAGLIFAYLHFDFYPITTLSPLPLVPATVVGILGGLSIALYVTRDNR